MARLGTWFQIMEKVVADAIEQAKEEIANEGVNVASREHIAHRALSIVAKQKLGYVSDSLAREIIDKELNYISFDKRTK